MQIQIQLRKREEGEIELVENNGVVAPVEKVELQ